MAAILENQWQVQGHIGVGSKWAYMHRFSRNKCMCTSVYICKHTYICVHMYVLYIGFFVKLTGRVLA